MVKVGVLEFFTTEENIEQGFKIFCVKIYRPEKNVEILKVVVR